MSSINPGDVVEVLSQYGKVLERRTTETVDAKIVKYAVRLWERDASNRAAAMRVVDIPKSPLETAVAFGMTPGSIELFSECELTVVQPLADRAELASIP